MSAEALNSLHLEKLPSSYPVVGANCFLVQRIIPCLSLLSGPVQSYGATRPRNINRMEPGEVRDHVSESFVCSIRKNYTDQESAAPFF